MSTDVPTGVDGWADGCRLAYTRVYDQRGFEGGGDGGGWLIIVSLQGDSADVMVASEKIGGSAAMVASRWSRAWGQDQALSASILERVSLSVARASKQPRCEDKLAVHYG